MSEASGESKALLCPSARCEEGAFLLGIVQRDMTVAFTPDEIRVDATFVEIAHRGRKPEARFRFASPCLRRHCGQWTGGHCGVADAVVQQIAQTDINLPESLPECAIRPRCRWFSQSGANACRACPFVITELDPVVTPE